VGTLLTPRPAAIPAWDTLSADQKLVYAHEMEVYAGALAHCDYQIGRVVQAVKDMGQFDNTIVIYIQGDNGASSLGGPNGSLNDEALMNVVPQDIDYLKAHLNEMGGPNARSGVSARLGPCDGYAVPVAQGHRVAFRGHAQRHGDFLAAAHQGPGRHPHSVPSRDRCHADASGCRRHPAADDPVRHHASSRSKARA